MLPITLRDRTPRKAYELDNLLITQGWSSYEWNTVRTTAPKVSL